MNSWAYRATLTRSAMVAGLTLTAGTAFAESWESKDPKEAEYLAQSTFEQKLDAQIPTDLAFRDDKGRDVTLADYLDGGKPVVFVPVYYRCPGICNATLNGLMLTLKGVDLEVGDKYEVVTFSFDPTEDTATAAGKKKTYLDILGRPAAADGWHFLTGEEDQIRALCEAIGFSYAYMEENGEYAHEAGLVFATPEGRISRYMPGVEYPIRDFRFNLMAASEGEIGSVADKIFAKCFAFNPRTGAYTPVITRSLAVGCVAIVTLLVGMLIFLIRFDLHKHRGDRDPAVASGHPVS